MGVGDETAGDERSAQVRHTATFTCDDVMGNALHETALPVEDPQKNESLVDTGLIGQRHKVVADLVQDRFANGEVRLELENPMRERDHRARDGARFRRDAQAVMTLTGKCQRSAHADERGKRRQIAIIAGPLATRQLITDLCGKRHVPTPPYSRAASRGARCSRGIASARGSAPSPRRLRPNGADRPCIRWRWRAWACPRQHSPA